MPAFLSPTLDRSRDDVLSPRSAPFAPHTKLSTSLGLIIPRTAPSPLLLPSPRAPQRPRHTLFTPPTRACLHGPLSPSPGVPDLLHSRRFLGNDSHAEAVVAAAGSDQARRVFVLNLPYSATKDEVYEFMLDRAGPVKQAEILTTPEGKSKGCAVVEFEDVATAEKAIAQVSMQIFDGRSIFVRPVGDEDIGVRSAVDETENDQDNHPEPIFGQQPIQLYIGNVPPTFSWQDLKDLFKPFGPASHVNVCTVRKPGEKAEAPTWGTLQLGDPAQAQRAMNHFSSGEVESRFGALVVRPWEERPEEVSASALSIEAQRVYKDDPRHSNPPRQVEGGEGGVRPSAWGSPHTVPVPQAQYPTASQLYAPKPAPAPAPAPARAPATYQAPPQQQPHQQQQPQQGQWGHPHQPYPYPPSPGSHGSHGATASNPYPPSPGPTASNPYTPSPPPAPTFIPPPPPQQQQQPPQQAPAYGTPSPYPPSRLSPGQPRNNFPREDSYGQENRAFNLRETPTQIIVKFFPFETDQVDLLELFTSTGATVTAVEILRNEKVRNLGIVEFASEDEATEAIKTFNGYRYGGRQLAIRAANDPFRFSFQALRPGKDAPAAAEGEDTGRAVGMNPLEERWMPMPEEEEEE
ncbi:hypothetical protein CALVIDRAFT_532442 [Calocera viscosa TUFC12733]|uniref:RRM domain-containing protein n=1 Tax=Calocera viscosa (strain TUFC12733) TaxID=1330018 RepID=A0A167S8F4_CALVF|nr:hypothetical protein CALVIDRAFT_532442 [Calocera viscosa TUFC12733]